MRTKARGAQFSALLGMAVLVALSPAPALAAPDCTPSHLRPRVRMETRRGASALLLALLLALLPAIAFAQGTKLPVTKSASGEEFVHLDFSDVELPALIDTIARLTGKNFIYDDRVRGRVTIVSPSPVTIDQAYAVFESVLKVKGFTAVPGPGGVMKVTASHPAVVIATPNTRVVEGAHASNPSREWTKPK